MTRSFVGLKKRYDFRKTYESGSSWANRLLVLYVVRKANIDSFRVGFSVSKRVGGAIVRNKVKRRLKEIVHTLFLNKKFDGDLIIIARAGASTASFSELYGALSDLLRRAKVLY